jgi:outer membrane biosynthesis protein TonB
MLDYVELESKYQLFYDKHMGTVSKCKPSSTDEKKEKTVPKPRAKTKVVTKNETKTSHKTQKSTVETPKEKEMLDLLDLLEGGADNSILSKDSNPDENIFLLEDDDTNLMPPPTPVKKTRAKKSKLKLTI